MGEDQEFGLGGGAAPTPAPGNDPYTGQHGEAIYAVWHDPTNYDHMTMGPPYLPEAKVRVASAEQDVLKSLVAQEVNASPIEQVFLALVSDYQGIPFAEIAALLSCLRAAAVVHQAHHWQTRGEPFFADHKLYEDLYNGSLPLIDKLAERAVGSSTFVLVHPVVQTMQVASLTKFFCGEITAVDQVEDYPVISLVTEVRLLGMLGIAYARLEAANQLSHGTDNLLQDIADTHEGFLYLLRQRSMSKMSSSYDFRPR